MTGCFGSGTQNVAGLLLDNETLLGGRDVFVDVVGGVHVLN